ncbi:TetR/AcrR family transcriptional regulator [Plastoroseomonas hellenica]
MECFWKQGFEATSMRDLIERTGITGASLYNAFGDKRALYQRALDHYVAGSRPAGAGVAQGCRCDGSRLP